MRRALAGLGIVLTAMLSACSSSSDEKIYTTEANAIVPSSGYFGQPISVNVKDGSMQLAVSELRLETNSGGSSGSVPEKVAIVDVKGVTEFGAPFLDPGQFHLFAPDGQEFPQLKSPGGFLNDPLTRTEMPNPGQETQGSVGFVIPEGIRLGRLDFVSDHTTVSFTVIRQPANPADATATAGTNSG